MRTNNSDTRQAPPPRETSVSRGGWGYWSVLAAFYIFLMFRPLIPDIIVPLETLASKALPFTYLRYHHDVFQQILSILLALLAAWVVVRVQKLSDNELGWVKPGSSAAILSPVMSASAFFVLMMAFYWPGHWQLAPGKALAALNPILISFELKTVILLPVMEEIVFRGVLFAALYRRLSISKVILVTSVLHLLLHYNPSDLTGFFLSQNWQPQDTRLLVALKTAPQLFAFSVLAGWLRYRYKTLWSPIVFHILYSLLISLISWQVL
jgi:membrane protease YdiL (CAAX protease family)